VLVDGRRNIIVREIICSMYGGKKGWAELANSVREAVVAAKDLERKNRDDLMVFSDLGSISYLKRG